MTHAQSPGSDKTALVVTAKPFVSLTLDEFHALAALRSQVFVVEQACIYQDLDGRDPDAWHILAWQGSRLAGCARLFAPGVIYDDAANFGRFVTDASVRGQGAGRAILEQALGLCQRLYGPVPVRISAQVYLAETYGRYGFVPEGAPYDDAGIPHIDMILRTATS